MNAGSISDLDKGTQDSKVMKFCKNVKMPPVSRTINQILTKHILAFETKPVGYSFDCEK